MILGPILLALSLNAAPGPRPDGPVEQLAALLGKGDCDAAFLLLPQFPVPASPTPATRAAAAVIAPGAQRCATDPALALAFSGLAARLAPDDPALVTSHAEALLALHETGEAAALLDRLVQASPVQQAARAWWLRGELAEREAEDALAVRLLTPLAMDPQWQARATPALERARTRLAEAERAKSLPAPAPLPLAPRRAPAAPRRHEPGTVITQVYAAISLGGEKLIDVRGLEVGRPYVFRAAGSCRRAPRVARTACGGTVPRSPNLAPIFGSDFRVRIGSAEGSHNLATGQWKDEESRVSFVAEAERITIRVFDASSVDREVSCTMGSFSVVAE